MSTCSRCGATFSCGMADDKSATPCWCTQLPLLMRLEQTPGASCYCPECLTLLTNASPKPIDTSP